MPISLLLTPLIFQLYIHFNLSPKNLRDFFFQTDKHVILSNETAYSYNILIIIDI